MLSSFCVLFLFLFCVLLPMGVVFLLVNKTFSYTPPHDATTPSFLLRTNPAGTIWLLCLLGLDEFLFLFHIYHCMASGNLIEEIYKEINFVLTIFNN